MMKQEFEVLAGYEVSIDDYNKIIEPMYMATSLSKEEFVKTISKKRFALRSLKSIVKEMKQIAKHLEDTCDHYHDTEAHDRLHVLVDEYLERRGYIIEGIRYASYMIDDEMTVFKCYHPSKIVIYGRNDYKTIETINLI